MMARILRFVVAAQLAAAFAIALGLAHLGWSAWLALAAAATLPVVVQGVLLAIQFATGALLDRRAQARLSLARAVRLWWRETWISVVTFGWRMPFRAGSPLPAIHRNPAVPAVLLVHGYLCNRAIWRPLLASDTLARANVLAVNLEPVFGSIDRYADLLHDAIIRLRADSGAARVILVCHSMGGLAARAYLRAHGDALVARVITLATPHAGTVFGRVGIGANARQMAPRSRYLRELAEAENKARRAKFVCIASRDDNLIVPRSSPLLAGARHVVLEQIGHLTMTAAPAAWQHVAQEIERINATGTPTRDSART